MLDISYYSTLAGSDCSGRILTGVFSTPFRSGSATVRWDSWRGPIHWRLRLVLSLDKALCLYHGNTQPLPLGMTPPVASKFCYGLWKHKSVSRLDKETIKGPFFSFGGGPTLLRPNSKLSSTLPVLGWNRASSSGARIVLCAMRHNSPRSRGLKTVPMYQVAQPLSDCGTADPICPFFSILNLRPCRSHF